jgi:hypothetical protein
VHSSMYKENNIYVFIVVSQQSFVVMFVIRELSSDQYSVETTAGVMPSSCSSWSSSTSSSSSSDPCKEGAGVV